MTDWQVITGDCLEVMPTLEAGSVDAIITDIPYGTTACSWDSVIPFEPMWSVIKHVLKPRGVFVTTASQPFTSALVMSNVKWFKHEWVWDKAIHANFMLAKIEPLEIHENILIFCDGKATYNPQNTGDAQRLFGKLSDSRSEHHGFMPHTGVMGVGYPKSIIRSPRPNNLSGGGMHPTQKPVALYEYLIRTYTNEGELVLDMCAGSGTTGVAALNTGRRVICIEKREDYADIARARIAKAAEQARQGELFAVTDTDAG